MAVEPPVLPGLVFREHLDSGGAADVLLYEREVGGSKVAVKVLKREGLTETIIERFRDEAVIMASLADHPNIVRILGSEVLPDGSACLLMTFYPPPNLAVRTRHDPLSVESVLGIGVQLAGAVETAHRAGIIHRDIKPANVLLSADGLPGLTDFGVAGNVRARRGVSGDDLGVSVPWSPPEVLDGSSDGDARTDVYSIAATLWQLLVGRSPFEQPGGDNSTLTVAERIRTNPAPSTGNPSIPSSLERLLSEALSKQPTARPASALALAGRLQAIERELGLASTALIVLEGRGEHWDRLPGEITSEASDHDAASRRPRRESASALDRLRGIPARLGEQRKARARAEGTWDGDHGPERQSLLARLGSRARLLVVVITAIVAVAAIAVSVSGLGASPPQTSVAAGTTPPTWPSDTPTRSAVPPPDQPAVVARSVPGGVEFSWTYAEAHVSDTFRYRSARTGGALAGAPLLRGDSSPLTIDGASGELACFQVQVVRESGVAGPLSAASCGNAG